MDVSRIQSEATQLLPLAERALGRYSFRTREISHLASHSNVMYRVVAENGHQMVLRVGTPHANSRSNLEAEVAWLDALVAETDLDVVRALHARDGSLIVDEYDEVLGKERSCVLFSWVPGQPMGEGSGTFAYRLLGEVCASLQAHGRTWRPPSAIQLRQWDQVFYYQRDFDPVVILDPSYAHLFDRPLIRTIDRAFELASEVIADSYEDATPQVVHGDLHEWNVHLAGSRLHAFDFEDVMLALPAQDASICLYSTRGNELRDDIWASFRKGYETVAPWPVVDERQLDGFHAARQIMLMNYAARTLPGGEATEYFEHVAPWLQRYVARYG